MAKGTSVIVTTGELAWQGSAGGPSGLSEEDALPLEDLLASSGMGRLSRVILLPPACAVIWLEAEEVSPKVLRNAPLPFLAPHLPEDYLDRFQPELWQFQPTGRGTWRVAYLLYDREAVDRISREAGNAGFLTPWEILAEEAGEGAYRILDKVYRVVIGDGGSARETRVLPAASAPAEWGRPVDVPLDELIRLSGDLPGRRLGKRSAAVPASRWVLAAGVFLFGLAVLVPGFSLKAAAEKELADLKRLEAEWCSTLSGRGCERGELINSVRRAIVMGKDEDKMVLSFMSRLNSALQRSNVSSRVERVVLTRSSGLISLDDGFPDEERRALLRAGFVEKAGGVFSLDFPEGNGR